MNDSGIKMTVTVNTLELLDKLRVNLKRYEEIYAEAIQGWEEALRGKFKELQELGARRLESMDDTSDPNLGVLTDYVIALGNMQPHDHTGAYSTFIGALEMHLEAGGETIELDMTSFRALAEDRWDWMDRFLSSSRPFSELARTRK